MYNGLLHLHSVLRWVILILLILAIFKSLNRHQPFTSTHQKIGTFLLIACDIQLLIGLYEWFAGPLGLKFIQSQGMSQILQDPTQRFYAIEHPTAMVLAIVLVHIGKSYAKRNISDTMKHGRSLLFFGLALLIILISIPWPFRDVGYGKHWFPGM